MKPLLGLFPFDIYGRTGYIYCFVVLFILFFVARHLVHSPFGLELRGIRQNALRMPALGAPVNRRLVAVYTIGAAYAGVAGALLTQTTQFVSIDVLSFPRSAELLLILVLGGTGSLYGAMLGTIVFMVAHHLLADINPQYWQFWLGLLLVLVVLFAREGIMGGLRRLGAQRFPRASPAGAPTMTLRSADAQSRQEVRGLRRHRRRDAQRRGRRAPCADRPQRRRQDDAHQPADRVSGTDGGRGDPRGRRRDGAGRSTPASSAAWRARSRSTGCSPT